MARTVAGVPGQALDAAATIGHQVGDAIGGLANLLSGGDAPPTPTIAGRSWPARSTRQRRRQKTYWRYHARPPRAGRFSGR